MCHINVGFIKSSDAIFKMRHHSSITKISTIYRGEIWINRSNIVLARRHHTMQDFIKLSANRLSKMFEYID